MARTSGQPCLLTATLGNLGTPPTTLGGVEVSFGGQKAPLLYVSDSQINAIVPKATGPLTITNGANSSPAFPLGVLASLPQVFRKQDGSAAALNQDGSFNAPGNPAPAATIVSIWVTGINDLRADPGQIVTMANNACSTCQVNFYGEFAPGPIATQATVLYAGPAPGMPSRVSQINFEVPSLPVAFAYFNVTADGVASDPVFLYFNHLSGGS